MTPPPPPVTYEVREVSDRYGNAIEVRAIWHGVPVPGDFDSDNDCDLDDLLIVAGMPLVDLDDLLLVQANIGYSDRCLWVVDGRVTAQQVTFGIWWRPPRGWSRVTVAYD